jgi:hypothetical protein
MKINMGIVNVVTYKRAKNYYKFLYIIGYTNITKYDKICRLNIYILRSRTFVTIV